MRLRLAPRAFADREAIFDYLRLRSPSGVRNVMGRIEQALILLSEQPLSGHRTDIENVRVLLVGKYPYKIFYRVREDAIEVLHIRHTSRRPSELD